MSNIIVLNKKDIIKSLNVNTVIEAVEQTYLAKSSGQTDVFPTVFHDFVTGEADLDIKSGYLKDKGLFGHKTVTFYADNMNKGLPTINGIITVFDAETGIATGITDGAYITGIRTGAAGAIGVKYLANKTIDSALIIGAGNQSVFQIASLLTVAPRIKRITIADIDIERASSLAESLPERLLKEFSINTDNVIFMATNDVQKAVKENLIIITITPSRKPYIKKEWIQPGTHISCIGADMEGKQELEENIMVSARIFNDDITHCMEVGEIETAIKKGIISEQDIAGEIGNVINGNIQGRKNNEEITIYDATGMALLDIAVAEIAIRYAKNNGIGTTVNI